ncbi:MAG: hypothetical protein ACRC46_12880 [Thermoguttaceae bacterium]
MFAGCSSLDAVNHQYAKLKTKMTPPGPPTQVVAVWDQAVKTGGEAPQRGFAGRVYLYPGNTNKPVKCDGYLVVYAFDETDRAVGDNAPTRSYVFSPEDLKKHCYSKSSIGHSYNLWIPWDSAGPEGKSREVSLIVKHEPETGSTIVSSQTKVYLMGGPRDSQRDSQIAVAEKKNAPRDIQQTSFTPDGRIVAADSANNTATNGNVAPGVVCEDMITSPKRAQNIETYTITRSAQGAFASRSQPAGLPAPSGGVVPAVAVPAASSPSHAASPYPIAGQTTPIPYR